MKELKKLFVNNQNWVEEKLKENSKSFKKLKAQIFMDRLFR